MGDRHDNFEEALHDICARLRLPEPHFVDPKIGLEPNQKVRLILDTKETIVEGKATGRKKKGQHECIYTDERGRKWKVHLPWYGILVR
jgi:hypothetical protein